VALSVAGNPKAMPKAFQANNAEKLCVAVMETY
jgi:hypothetical protein